MSIDGQPHPIIARLAAELGDRLSTDDRAVRAAMADRSGHASSTPPLAVVHAESIADVQATMRAATEFAVPVVTRGAGTGLAGGAIASDGELVLSTLRMNRVLEIVEADELAVVEPGIINDDLNRLLEPLGLWFSPDPASKHLSTVGGNIATNAGGLQCAKYGVTRDSVLGLSVVTADGRLLELGRRTVKGVTGLDLTSLMIGSEGTLGVIVGATLRLKRLDRGDRPTVSATFATVESAASAAAAITDAGLQPALLELVGPSALELIARHLALRLEPGAHLVAQWDGPGASLAAESGLAIMRAHGGTGDVSTDAAHAERLLAIRRSFHGAVAARGTVLIEDVAVPRSRLPEMFAAIGELERRFGMTIPTVAHAADGNLHPNFLVDGDTVPDAVWTAAGELFERALALGGTLTGEHGVGLLKRRWLGAELGDDQLELQRQIKAVFDPLGILNPGKVY